MICSGKKRNIIYFKNKKSVVKSIAKILFTRLINIFEVLVGKDNKINGLITKKWPNNEF